MTEALTPYQWFVVVTVVVCFFIWLTSNDYSLDNTDTLPTQFNCGRCHGEIEWETVDCPHCGQHFNN